ncbi:UNVERIFIED_CONTAM: hypothetical protein FKN15_043021 [Acipenser sinensis]
MAALYLPLALAGPAVAWVLLILVVGVGSSARVEVQVPSSVNCAVGQDCVLSCTFNFTSDMKDLAVTWTWKKKEYTIHSYFDNTDQLAQQLPQYVNRTSLFDSELQRGNASLLLRRVTEEDAGEFKCRINSRLRYGISRNDVISHNPGAVNKGETEPSPEAVPGSSVTTEPGPVTAAEGGEGPERVDPLPPRAKDGHETVPRPSKEGLRAGTRQSGSAAYAEHPSAPLKSRVQTVPARVPSRPLGVGHAERW